jgi:hypothetical protein
VTHTIRQTDIPALPDSWATNSPSFKIFCPQKLLGLMVPKNITCLSVGLRITVKVPLPPVQLRIEGLRQIAVS